MKVIAPAKINLFLHIVGKRENGYHELDSLAVFTTFGDTLEFIPSDTLRFEIQGPFAHEMGSHSGNIVLKAAESLRAATKCRAGVRIVLHKHIPVGAGLGGGSSDAAATLKALNDLWGLQLSDSKLAEIGMTLGSDVPVCLKQGAAYIRGIGDEILPVTLKGNIWIILVNPLKPLLTADVFKAYKAPFSKSLKPIHHFNDTETLLKHIAELRNDLQPVAVSLMPEIDLILQAIAGTEGCRLARMSGSGATCFGIYASQALALAAQHAITQSYPRWWTTVTKVMESHEAQ